MSTLTTSPDLKSARADFCNKVERADLKSATGVFNLMDRLCPGESFHLNDSNGRGVNITRKAAGFDVILDLSAPRADLLDLKSYEVSRDTITSSSKRETRTNPAALFEPARYRPMLGSELLSELTFGLASLARAMRSV